MEREFISMPSFDRDWQDMGLSEDQLAQLQDTLGKNPQLGDVISSVEGMRKVRFELPGKGKRGGARVIYVDFVVYEKIYLIATYPKSVKSNLTSKDKKAMKNLVKVLKENLENKQKN